MHLGAVVIALVAASHLRGKGVQTGRCVGALEAGDYLRAVAFEAAWEVEGAVADADVVGH